MPKAERIDHSTTGKLDHWKTPHLQGTTAGFTGNKYMQASRLQGVGLDDLIQIADDLGEDS